MVRSACIALVLMLPLATVAADSDADYLQQVTQWRADFDADLVKDGWLVLVGRERIAQGMTTIGSSPDSRIVLPASAPKRVGHLTRRGATFEFAPARNVVVWVDDRRVTSPVKLSPQKDATKIRVGSIALTLREIGGDYFLSIADEHSPAIAAFKGTTWFPVDSAYRVPARFLPYETPRQVALALTFASASKMFTSTGDVAFELSGRPLKLMSLVDGDELFLIFQDETNGTETYGGGRYLSAPLPINGVTTLDFNKAFNPYCAVNSYVICALTPAQNRLDVRISAGARFQK